jgi:hypothetical protein
LADFFADLDDGGGGVFSIFRRPASKSNPQLEIGDDLATRPLNILLQLLSDVAGQADTS